MTMIELAATQDAIQRLAEWHESNARFRVLVTRDDVYMVGFHIQAATDCRNAAIALGEYYRKLSEG